MGKMRDDKLAKRLKNVVEELNLCAEELRNRGLTPIITLKGHGWWTDPRTLSTVDGKVFVQLTKTMEL